VVLLWVAEKDGTFGVVMVVLVVVLVVLVALMLIVRTHGLVSA
jgi:hypothetical protein